MGSTRAWAARGWILLGLAAACGGSSVAPSDAGAGDGAGVAPPDLAAGHDLGPPVPLPDPSRAAPFNLAPPTRTLSPVALTSSQGALGDPANVLAGQPTTLGGEGAQVVLDFGKEVGGVVTIRFTGASDASQSVGLAFSESRLYVGPVSDKSNGSGSPDGALTVPVAGASTYTMPRKLLRGGFRYLTVFLQSSGTVSFDQVTLDYSPDPLRAVPNVYPNYFYSNDDVLNKAWYAGAYTYQTNLARVNEGRVWPPTSTNWDNSATIGELGEVVLVDGAKRDRAVWPGDMLVSVPTGFVALDETVAVKDSLQTLFNHQGSDGALPYAGPPFNFGGSDSYHLWTLLGVSLYYDYTGDKSWVQSIWTHYQSALAYSLAKIDTTGLLDVTGTNDWARDNPGGYALPTNVILYRVLTTSAALAREAIGDEAYAQACETQAAALKVQIKNRLWDGAAGAYKDNPTSTLHPQDGNALAVWFGIIDDVAKKRSVSAVLNENWNDKGSRGPEFTLSTGVPRISTFASSMELMAHFEAGYDTRALELIRTMWGFMLSSENGTGSTFWEGFNSDGTFAYQDSFTSLAHGWGTGPTSALTFYVLGAAPEGGAGASYRVAPHPGDLRHVEGSLTFPNGVLTVSYDVGEACASLVLRVDSSKLLDSTGRIGVPTFGASHAIVFDGAPAWDGTSFLGSSAASGASAEGGFVWFTGVRPGIHTFAFTDGAACAPPPERWLFCSDENGRCAFQGRKRVRFGRYGHYSYGLFTDGVPCDTTSFPDPLANVVKACAISDELYTPCASENGTCAFQGTKEVRFGANDQWVSKVLTDGTPCTTQAFGDPLPDVLKRCELRDP